MAFETDSRTALIKMLDLVKCSRCRLQMNEPFTSNKMKCRHSFCSPCLSMESDVLICPRCNTNNNVEKDMVKDFTLEKIIRKLNEYAELIKEDFSYSKRQRMENKCDVETRQGCVENSKKSEMKSGLQTVKAIVHRGNESSSGGEEDELALPLKDNKSKKPQKEYAKEDGLKEGLLETSIEEVKEMISPRLKDRKVTPLKETKKEKNLEAETMETENMLTPLVRNPANRILRKKNSKGETTLHRACIFGNISEITQLLERGANPNTTDNAGWTPLHEVVANGNYEAAEILLRNGAICNVPGSSNETALHEAVRSGLKNIVRLLSQYGADFHAKNSNGETPFSLASEELRKMFFAKHVRLQNDSFKTTSYIQVENEMEAMHVVGVDLSREMKVRLNKLAKLHKNLSVDATISSKTTHVLVETNKSNECIASCGVLQAVMRGLWVLSTKWLTECTDDDLANIDPFEISGIAGYDVNGAKDSRTNRFMMRPRLFNGCHVYFKGLNSSYDVSQHLSVNKQILASLVSAGGGIVLRREPNPESIPKDEQTIPYHAVAKSKLSKCSHYIIYTVYTEPAYNMSHIKALPLIWLIDSICTHQLKEPI